MNYPNYPNPAVAETVLGIHALRAAGVANRTTR